MKIKHKVTGKVVELMDGTKFAKSAYDLVDEKAAKVASDKKNTDDGQVKKVTDQKSTKTTKNNKKSKTGTKAGKTAKTTAKKEEVKAETQPPVEQ